MIAVMRFHDILNTLLRRRGRGWSEEVGEPIDPIGEEAARGEPYKQCGVHVLVGDRVTAVVVEDIP